MDFVSFSVPTDQLASSFSSSLDEKRILKKAKKKKKERDL